jgi:hypothetical protein
LGGDAAYDAVSAAQPDARALAIALDVAFATLFLQ